MVSGRLSDNSIVHIPGDASMIGSYVDVLIKESKGFYYIGIEFDKNNNLWYDTKDALTGGDIVWRHK